MSKRLKDSQWHRGIIFLAVFGIYLFTLANTIVWRDTPEFTLVAYALDIAHSPGSPTFGILGKLATLLPFGSIAFRVSLLSVFCSALAATILFACIQEIQKRLYRDLDEVWIAFIAVFAFVLSRSTWEWGNAQEVYALRDAFFAVILFLCLHRQFYVGAFLWGLSLGAHITMVLFAPAYLFWILVHRRSSSESRPLIQHLSLLSALAFLGMSAYLYLPLRASFDLPLNIGNPDTLKRMLRHMFVTSDQAAQFSFFWGRLPSQILRFLSWIKEEFSLPLTLLGIPGIYLVVSRFWRLGVFLHMLFFAIVAFFIRTWSAPFGFVPAFMVYAIFIGFGMHLLIRSISSKTIKLAFFVTMMFLCGFNGIRHAEMNEKPDTARRHGLAILSTLPQDAILFSANDNVSLIVAYLRFVEGKRPDISQIHRTQLFDKTRTPEQWRHITKGCELLGYDPFHVKASLFPAIVQKWPACPAFWDYGKDQDQYISLEYLTPHGILFKIWPDPMPLTPLHIAEQAKHIAPFADIISRLTKYDWTGVQNYVRVWSILGEYYDLRGNLEEAQKSFEAGQKINPNDSMTLINLGSLLARAQKWPKAISLFQTAIQQNPTHLLAYNHLAAADLEIGNLDAAEQILKKSLRLEPDQPETQHRLARLYLRQKKFNLAMPILISLHQHKHSSEMQLKIEQDLIHVYDLNQDCAPVLQIVRQPFDIHYLPETLLIYGICSQNMGDHQRAKDAFSQALQRCQKSCAETELADQIRLHLKPLTDIEKNKE